ncbi:multidrug resistance-associated ABC transporter [Schizopora paradoxa]|uniref:Multidrug resistance-associated ABC transporter n=1 Tax=Schizopora paradoxa TaxID=27342 RepID=A0A0H2S536_9AGAM|nr:multidrug resistance-associated ABC transporter [Schizopora paradoxa]
MTRLEFEVGILLSTCCLLSVAFFVLDWKRSRDGGSIQLPLHDDGEEELDGGSSQSDPFPITKPVDVLDGYPIREDEFWRKMRVRKVLLSIVACLLAVVQSIGLGWSLVSDESARVIVQGIAMTTFSVYILALSLWSISLCEVRPHWKLTIHLAILTTMAFVLLCSSTILPSKAPVEEPKKTLWYLTFALVFVEFWIATRTKRGPKLHYPSSAIYSEKILAGTTTVMEDNVCGITDASPWDIILFSYTTKVVMLGYTAQSLEIGDLPIVPANMRAAYLFAKMKVAVRKFKLRRSLKPGSGWGLSYTLIRANSSTLVIQIILTLICALLFYVPYFFLQKLVASLEEDPDRTNISWGWAYCFGLILSNLVSYLMTAQLWSISTTTMQSRLKVELNTMLFAKTLVRKDVASSTASSSTDDKKDDANKAAPDSEKKEDEDEFSSKAQIMTLMTTDVDRISDFAWHFFAIFDSPIEIAVGTLFLYRLLGVSSFVGLAVTCLLIPINHFASKVVVGAQDNLMKARDERVALMNEVLGAIRMLKFMAWERSFEKRVLKIREKELRYQRLNYLIEALFNCVWAATPLFVTLVSFWHFAVYRGQTLTPSIAFTSIAVFSELKFALNALPETFISMLQGFVSVRRIEKYLHTAEIKVPPPFDGTQQRIVLQSATISWPVDKTAASSVPSSAASTPRRKFILVDLSLKFPDGELSLICGKLGSGKTLLLLSLLGEADVLAGHIVSTRSPPDAIASFAEMKISTDDWIVPGACAYVPQSAWLQNATIRENIIFNLPFDKERYERTLEVCALVSDLKILEDGDESEIGERGVNLSGGQKARVSLARAVYSRASVLFLDDVLSAVDAHTAHHLYHECLKGDLMKGRTIILVSHHVQLCSTGASYVVALDNGRVAYSGDSDGFKSSGVMTSLVQSESTPDVDAKEEEEIKIIEELPSKAPSMLTLSRGGSDDDASTSPDSEVSSTLAASSEADVKVPEKRKARKLIEEEKRAVGRIGKAVWLTYFKAIGGKFYWFLFITSIVAAALTPAMENGWLSYWSGAPARENNTHGTVYYITVYALVTFVGLILQTSRWFVLYDGSIRASTVLYKRLLQTVLFAQIRFHDTVSRGRLLNRFGKDFEGIDSSLSDNFGRSVINALSATVTIGAITFVGGLPFAIAAVILGFVYYNVAKVYGQCSRDMRRLDSVSRSPLYSIYGETIAGVPIIRAFGASSKFMRDMIRCVDTNINPYYWLWSVNRWISARFNILSSFIVGVTAVLVLVSPNISAAQAGFALAFASTVSMELLFMVRRFVGLEQSMVAVERVKEFSELPPEGPEFVEPRPPASWPSEGRIECEDLVIRYAPELPDVLHNLNFSVKPGERVGILGRTGSGKSTLALSFFRFVEATAGRIVIDGIDISKIGLTDLRSKITIIPQDPTILSGTLRSTLDVFDEYEDAEIYEALRRVHLIPSEDTTQDDDEVNANVFRNLDSSVSEGGENFSTGEKQLLCMARAILKRSRVLVMDEATASVDYATDELIGKTIRQEFSDSTILTIAHRLRTVIDYSRVMLLEDGRIVEFDSPGKLLSDPTSKFYALCRAAGREEFSVLKKMAGTS